MAGTGRSYRSNRGRKTPGQQRRQTKAAAISKRRLIEERTVAYQQGYRPVLDADENIDISLDAILADKSIPLVISSEQAAERITGVFNWARGSNNQHCTWSTRRNGIWRTEDFTITFDEGRQAWIAQVDYALIDMPMVSGPTPQLRQIKSRGDKGERRKPRLSDTRYTYNPQA